MVSKILCPKFEVAIGSNGNLFLILRTRNGHVIVFCMKYLIQFCSNECPRVYLVQVLGDQNITCYDRLWEECWTTIPPKSTKQTTTSRLKPLNTERSLSQKWKTA